MVLLVVLYGFKTWSLILLNSVEDLSDDQNSEYKVLSKILGGVQLSDREKWKRTHNENLHWLQR